MADLQVAGPAKHKGLRLAGTGLQYPRSEEGIAQLNDICRHLHQTHGRRRLCVACLIIAALAALCPRTISGAAVPLDAALRTVETATDFSDYLAIASSTYAADIGKAVELGLVVGKYDRTSAYYDPDGLITTGEMVNILARNLGATTSTQGEAAATYLGDMGVRVSDRLDSLLSIGEMESLATQIASVPVAGRANLVVLRDALSGNLSSTQGGVTRAFAVAMYSTASGDTVPETTPTSATQPASPTPGTSTGKRRTAEAAPDLPTFVLTD